MRKWRRKNQPLDTAPATRENKDSCDMHRLTLTEWETLAGDNKLQKGDFCWGTTVVSENGVECHCRHLRHVLPDGNWGTIQIEPVPDAIKRRIVHGKPPKAHTWTWNGDEDRPTLQPSVHLVGYWHGHFTNGRMESCK